MPVYLLRATCCFLSILCLLLGVIQRLTKASKASLVPCVGRARHRKFYEGSCVALFLWLVTQRPGFETQQAQSAAFWERLALHTFLARAPCVTRLTYNATHPKTLRKTLTHTHTQASGTHGRPSRRCTLTAPAAAPPECTGTPLPL